jgi:drug/metabolite transporter (DMT)-like permease
MDFKQNLSVAGATLLVLVGMAANSLLARAALAGHLIGPTLFTLLRLAGGAALLAVLSAIRRVPLRRPRANVLWLFLYASAFSYTYVVLGAAMGALLLFFAVQLTMFVGAVIAGERPTAAHVLGGLLALAGLYILVALQLHRPAPWAVVGMLAAGLGWGLYSIGGRGVREPLAHTTVNFLYAALLGAVVALLRLAWRAGPRSAPHWAGLVEALVSGAVTSAPIYLLWYALLPRLRTVFAATVQLAVPVIVAVGGWAFLGEPVTARLAMAGTLVLAGVGLTMRRTGRPPRVLDSGPGTH